MRTAGGTGQSSVAASSEAESARPAAASRPPLVEWSAALDAALRRGPVLTPTRRLAREIAYAVDWHRAREGQARGPLPDVLSVVPS